MQVLYSEGFIMQHTGNWLEHIIAAADLTRDLTIYAQSWAHDARCVRSGLEHRRVGQVGTEAEWLKAGVVTRQMVLR